MADFLAFWGVTRDNALTRVDFGSVPGRSAGDIQFRVKNLSTRLTALDVLVSVEDYAAPGQALALWVSADGQTFGSAVSLDDLPASAISKPIWLRRVISSDMPAGANECRVRVHASGWTPTHS